MQKSNTAKTRRRKAGFTLVELLLVVTILGILAAVAVVNFVGFGDEAREKATRASISSIESAAKTWEIRTGKFPDSLDQLVQDGLLKQNHLNDPWGNPFAYKKTTVNGKPDIEIRSAGPDSQMNTQDDITN